MKKILKAILITILALIICWFTGRYGWRLLGFRACGGSGISSVEVTEQEVQISGFYPGSFPEGCVGTISKVENGTLYLGVRYDAVFGFFETGSFTVSIPVQEEIHTVVLRAGDNDYPIWNADEDEALKNSGFYTS